MVPAMCEDNVLDTLNTVSSGQLAHWRGEHMHSQHQQMTLHPKHDGITNCDALCSGNVIPCCWAGCSSYNAAREQTPGFHNTAAAMRVAGCKHCCCPVGDAAHQPSWTAPHTGRSLKAMQRHCDAAHTILQILRPLMTAV
jgi:hypothetical protein